MNRSSFVLRARALLMTQQRQSYHMFSNYLLASVRLAQTSTAERTIIKNNSCAASSNTVNTNNSLINDISRCHSSAAVAPTAAYDQTIRQPFPSLIIRGSDSNDTGIQALGSFAEAQAMYLNPDEECVNSLVKLLEETNMGIVAHYYMDVELQGVLQAAGKKLPPGRIGIADSLKMGDMAVEMVQKYNCPAVACLGVDFMSESVSAILGKNGYSHVPVYRATPAKIGCSLAESAERESYRAWLQKESANNVHALHVIYINTSLETKAVSSSIVPTITCTSSNVLQTLLTASAQISKQSDNWKILYGPDTYMGDNLITLLSTILNEKDEWDDNKIAEQLHPDHTRATLQTLRDNIRVFPNGNCVVHHMFGHSVVDTVKTQYNDCYVTAHLEVPGEMFEIAMSKSLNGQGVVGSTSDILNFITRKVQDAEGNTRNKTMNSKERLQFILGTEAGMVTSIVQNVQRILNSEANGSSHIEAEIIFPVASEAVTSTDDGGLVPGVAGGEGCSTAGGCATCPFMKMNNLDALMDVLEMVKQTNSTSAKTNNNEKENIQSKLMKHLPPDKLRGKMINGQSAIDLGTQPIVYMRSLNSEKRLPDELLNKVLQRI